jgi:TPR repeat protein
MPSRLKNTSRKNQDLIIRNLNESFSVLEYAGQKGCAPALLIAGGLYINGRRGKNFPVGGEASNNELRKGISFLNQVSPPSIESNFYLAKASFMLQQRYSKDLIDKLLPACKADYAEAWLLLGDISSKKGNVKFETLAEYYEKAAKLGSFRAYDRLGWLYYRKGKIEKANQYWKEFVEHDSEERLNNIFDLYGGKISAPEFGILFTSRDTKEIQNYYHNY